MKVKYYFLRFISEIYLIVHNFLCYKVNSIIIHHVGHNYKII